MAVSRFTTPANFSPTSQYVQRPIGLYQQNLANQQEEYDIAAANTKALQDQIIKTQAREEDLPALKKINSAYSNALDSIVESSHKDLGSSHYRDKLNKLASNLKADMTTGNLAAIQSNYNTYQAYQKQLLEQKDNYSPYLDSQYLNIAPGFYQGYKKSDGTYNISKLGPINKAVDRYDAADKTVKGINSIGGSTPKFSKDAYGNDVILNEKGEFINPEKIRGAFRPAFVNTEAYQQIIQEANHNEAVANRKGVEFDKTAFINNTVNEIENSLVNKYRKSQIDRSVDFHNIPEYQQEKTPGSATTSNTQLYDNPSVVPEIPNINFDEKDQIIPPQGLKYSIREGFIGGSSIPGLGNSFANEYSLGIDQKALKEQTDFLDNLKKSNPQLANFSNKDAYSAYKDAVINNSKISSPTAEINNEKLREAYSNKVFKGGINNRGLSVVASNGVNTKISGLERVAKDLGLGKDELRDQLNNGRVSGFVNGDKPGMFKTTIIDKEGKPVTLAVDGDKEQQSYFQRSYNMTKLERENKTGKFKFTDPIDGIPYIVETRLVQDSNTGRWAFKTAVSQADNKTPNDFSINTATQPITDFNMVLREDANRFLSSPYAEKLK